LRYRGDIGDRGEQMLRRCSIGGEVVFPAEQVVIILATFGVVTSRSSGALSIVRLIAH
jgi:hypothetical protein